MKQTILTVALFTLLMSPYDLIANIRTTDQAKAQQLTELVELLDIILGPNWWVQQTMTTEPTKKVKEEKEVKEVIKEESKQKEPKKPQVKYPHGYIPPASA